MCSFEWTRSCGVGLFIYLLICLSEVNLRMSATPASLRWMIGWQWMMKWEACGRKWL